MEPLAPAQPALTKDQLIRALTKPVSDVMVGSDENDIDRTWILRKLHKNYLYYRDLAYFAPAIFQGLVDATGLDGSIVPENAWQGTGLYDYTQNYYKGYARKLEAVLGTRIPNAVAVPNDPSSEKDVAAARAANDAAQYIRQQCELQVQILWMVFSLFNFGTSFWSIEWVEDGDRYGWKEVPQFAAEDVQLGGQDGVPPFGVSAPAEVPPKRVAKGGLEICIKDATEVSVPLETDGMKGVSACLWLREEFEKHKAEWLRDYRDKIKPGEGESLFESQSVSLQYGESVRSAQSSPIGIVRPKRENWWTGIRETWTPTMYEMIDDPGIRDLMKRELPDGARFTFVKGRMVDIENRKLTAHWQECQPEPTKRIMSDPLGDDWIVTQDILNNTLNKQSESIERSSEPGFADPTRVDLQAWERRRDNPGDLIPAIPPAGRSLADIIFRPQPFQFSEQITPFRAQIEQASQQNTGLLEIIWGGDNSDPTARQSELKTNAAIRQLSVIWVMIGKSLERVYEKACALLAENEDGVLQFSGKKANEFGKFDQIAVVIEDLKSGNYHFEADEAIPMTWGQQRDLLMWMLDKPAEILKAWGLDDPMNIFEFKNLLGMPGERVPHLAERDKGMALISQLLADGSVSVEPDWEDDADFMTKLVKAYLTDNFELKNQNPDGYQRIQALGQAYEKIAQQQATPPKPPVKASVALALKGSDLGSPAVQAALEQEGITPPGTQVSADPVPLKPDQALVPRGGNPPPGAGPMPPPPSPGGPVPSGAVQ